MLAVAGNFKKNNKKMLVGKELINECQYVIDACYYNIITCISLVRLVIHTSSVSAKKIPVGIDKHPT